MRWKIGIVLLLLCAMAGTAGAAAWINGETMIIQLPPSTTVDNYYTELDAWMASHPEKGNTSDWIEEVNEGVWEIKTNAQIWDCEFIVSSDGGCDELRMYENCDLTCNDANASVTFNNTTVCTWNSTTDTQSTVSGNYTWMSLKNINVTDTDFYAIEKIISNPMISGSVINSSVHDSIYGFGITDAESCTFSNVSFYNISLYGIYFTAGANCSLSNMNLYNDASFRESHSTGGDMISLNDGAHNFTISNVYADSPKWGGIYFGDSLPHDICLSNMTVQYAGHNGIDVHGGYNITLRDITSQNSYSNNYMVTGPTGDVPDHTGYGTYNISLYDTTSHNPATGNAGFSIASRVSHVYIENVSLTHEQSAEREGIKIFDCDNVTCVNVTTDGGASTAWKAVKSSVGISDAYLVDSILGGSSFADAYFYYCTDGKLINSDPTIETLSYSDVYQGGYYLDFIAKYGGNGTLVQDTYTITCNNSSLSSSNGLGTDCASFTTDENGRSGNPSVSRQNSPVLYETYNNVGTDYPLSYNITIRGVNFTEIEPSSDWLRSDYSTSEYILILDLDTELYTCVIPPVASFSANVTSGAAPLIVQFTDTSTNATSWSWDFDNDGTPDSTTQNPIYTYTEIGNYTVNLTVGNEAGNDSEVKIDYIKVGMLPDANFTGTPTSGTTPLTVTFTDTSANATSWLWDFGDGDTSNLQNPTNVYNSSGTYTVNLTVTNEFGNDTETKTNYITVTDPYYGRDGSDLASSAVPIVGVTVVTLISAVAIGALNRKFEIEPNQLVVLALGLLVIMVVVYLIYGIGTLMENTFGILD